jgi:hypothetical protein
MRIFWCQGGEADADIHRTISEAVSSHHFPRLDQRSTRSNIEDDDDDKDVSWRLTPHPMVSTAVIHVFVWRVITRITPNVDAQAGRLWAKVEGLMKR